MVRHSNHVRREGDSLGLEIAFYETVFCLYTTLQR